MFLYEKLKLGEMLLDKCINKIKINPNLFNMSIKLVNIKYQTKRLLKFNSVN